MSNDLKETIILRHQKGDGYRKISNSLHISKSTIAKVVQNVKKKGNAMVVSQRPGRLRKLTPRSTRSLLREVEKNRRASASDLAQAVVNQCGVVVSAQTVRLTLQEHNLHGRRPRRKPLLQARHKKARLLFANAYVTKPLHFWEKILWSDETKINLFGSDGIQKVWRRPHEEYKDKCMVSTMKHGGGSVMVWGSMSAQGVGDLHFIDSIMNAEMYCTILQEKMLPSLRRLGRGAMFQHDNDPKHSFLQRKKVKVIDWPSVPPDLNPIEHLWGVLKRKVEQRRPSNIRELKVVIQEEWSAIDSTVCSNLVHSMPRRVASVTDNGGGHIKY